MPSGTNRRSLVRGEKLGWLGQIHPAVLDNYDLTQPVLVAELDLENILAQLAGSGVYSAAALPGSTA